MHTPCRRLAEAADDEQDMDYEDSFDRMVLVLAALTRRLFSRVLGADDTPCRPVMGPRGDAGAAAGTATTAAGSSASGMTTVAAANPALTSFTPVHHEADGVFPGHTRAWPRPFVSPTIGLWTPSWSVLEHRRVPDTSADGQRGLLSTSFRRAGVRQRARAAPPATALPLDAAPTGDATPRERPAAGAPPARPAPAGPPMGWATMARGGGGGPAASAGRRGRDTRLRAPGHPPRGGPRRRPPATPASGGPPGRRRRGSGAA